MSTSNNVAPLNHPARPNGSGAAALLSAGVGSLALAIVALVADKSALVKGLLTFYRPTGPLSGVTTVAILIWLTTWGILEWRWREKPAAIGPISAIALLLLGLGLVLTFPPVVDLF
jgi:hypothetical protein